MKSKPKLDLKELISRLAPVAYPTLLEEYTRTCCIAAAAILIRVFDEYGYKAKVIPVTVQVYNAAMLRLLRSGTEIPTEPKHREIFLDLTGAWGVGIVPASGALSELSGTPSYGGHLLLCVGGFLVDATIRQAERPEKKMLLPNLVASQHAAELLRDGRLSLKSGECEIHYQRLNDESYRTAPDWVRRSTPYPETVRRILSRMDSV